MHYFFADDHYGVHPGRHIFELLPEEIRRQTVFQENQWDMLESGVWESGCDLLVLHMIAGTCGQPLPGDGAEKAVRSYCERGGRLLLLHGSSAAFWHWDWWRSFIGLRWVRPNDPDGIPASTHPTVPCTVEVSKVRHPLAARLKPFSLPEDEVYIDLEQMNPVTTLMETTIQGKTYPQAYLCDTPWGGRIASLIPGHKPECTTNPDLIADVTALIDWLTDKQQTNIPEQ